MAFPPSPTPVGNFLVRFGWSLAIGLVSIALYLSATHSQGERFNNLNARLSTLRAQIEEAEKSHRDLQLQVDNLDDPDFLKMAMIERLGMIPKNTLKVCFANRGDADE